MRKTSICFLSCCRHIFFSFCVGAHRKNWTDAIEIEKLHDLYIDELSCLLNIFSEFFRRDLRLKNSEFLSWKNLNSSLFWGRHSWERLRWRKTKIHERIFRSKWKAIWDWKKWDMRKKTKKKTKLHIFLSELAHEMMESGLKMIEFEQQNQQECFSQFGFER